MSQSMLSVRGLSKRFGALEVTRSVDLDLAPGARTALIGPNGAGKTTLVNLLTGVLRADAGEVRLAGVPITHDKPERRVRAGLVRTHQINTLLVETPARENVAIAIAERDGLAWRMLRYGAAWRACLEEADARLRDLGLGAHGDVRVSEMPYGHQRLLEMAIALAMRPRVLLLDEPAAGVPSSETHMIQDALARLPADIAILIIEHDMDLVFRFASEIVVLVQGGVLCRGTPAQIAAHDEVRAVYLGKAAA
jgi:branched-chain amino acid transport system ATP-binding protein